MDDYLTLAGESAEEYIINKSRFIGYACPVTSAEAAAEFVAAVRHRHPDATHNVYAYIIKSPEYSRYSDDGEPQGTAGMPVLDSLRKKGLTDCAVVVTRYFGGILLGTGGLVRAYSHTASLAVESARIVKMTLCSEFRTACPYNLYAKVSQLIPALGGTVIQTDFLENINLSFYIPAEKEAMFLYSLSDATLGAVTAEKTAERYDEVAV